MDNEIQSRLKFCAEKGRSGSQIRNENLSNKPEDFYPFSDFLSKYKDQKRQSMKYELEHNGSQDSANDL